MKKFHREVETVFEKVTSFTIKILGSSYSFILAFALVTFFLCNKGFYTQDALHIIRDLIPVITFLSLFVIQKEFNRFSAALHLKLNELVASHKPANNAVINIESKTEHEIIEMSKEYAELAEQAEKTDK